MKYFLHVLFVIILASLRIYGVKTQMFQGIAHVYVGGLLSQKKYDRIYFHLGLLLTGVEIICFIYGKLT